MAKPEIQAPPGFYRYTDGDGHVHIVDRLEAVPKAYRSEAEKVEAKGSRLDLFSFEDGDGHTLIADSLEAIPAKFRKVAKKIDEKDAAKVVAELKEKAVAAKKGGLAKAKQAQREVGDVVPFVKDLDIPSMMFGVGLTLVFVFVLSVMRRTGRVLAKIGLVLLIVAFVAGSYFAWIRRVAGLGDTKLSSPTAMIDDAKKAAKQMQDKLEAQQRILEKIEANER
ncbi:MAG: hypothetical protein RIT81_09155 [Deltaproteobacteria bacterium]